MQRPALKRPSRKTQPPAPNPEIMAAVSRITRKSGDAALRQGRTEALRDVRILLKSLEQPRDPARKALLAEIRAGLRDL